MRVIRKVQPRIDRLKQKRVAIYCRVSSSHDPQIESLETQITYFQNMVRRRLDSQLVDVYADRRSGKSIEGRPEFKRLLDDCFDGKVDMILTKTVSRFGRNTVDTVRLLRELRAKNVDVYFDLQELHSINDQNTFLITILEAYAQAENESRSENIKWGIQRSLQNPDSKLYNRICYGYRLGDDGMLAIEDEEARIVQMIYKLYLDGYSILGVLRELERLAIKSPTGKERWSKRTIDTMLSNEKYTGIAIRGKSFMEAYPSSKKKKNDGERPKIQIENNHPPIIDQAQFDRVQAEKKRRSNVQTNIDGTKRNITHYSMKQRTNQVVHNVENDDQPNNIEG